MPSRKRQARVAGALYLLMALCAVVSLNNIPSWGVTGGDAAATARQIVASPMAYRVGIVCDLAAQVLFVFLVLAFYELFKQTSRQLAMLMVALVLVQVPMGFLNTVLGMAPPMLLGEGGYLVVFERQEREAMAMFFVNLRGYGIRAVMMFWGLWLLPLGLLIWRSVLFPRIAGMIMGGLMVIGCLAYVATCVISLLWPDYAGVSKYLLPAAVGEVVLILWLLIVGVREGAEVASTG